MRTVLEPVRRLGLDHFHQGWADDIDFTRKVVRVEANTSDDLASRARQGANHPGVSPAKGPTFDVNYDKLAIAVGSYSQTFGIEGVKEHANFLRDVADARKIRMKILQIFEKAALPISSDHERRKLLHFAIVGGGPTGIEIAAELHDLIKEDLAKIYPGLMKFITITVYDVAPKVLPMFDKTLAQYAMDIFTREGISVKTEHHLTRIRPDDECDGCLKLKIEECGDEEVDAGIVIWSTGLMQNPLVEKLGSKTFEATPDTSTSQSGAHVIQLERDPRTGGIITDSHLRMLTSAAKSAYPGSDVTTALDDVYVIGDCAVIAGEHKITFC